MPSGLFRIILALILALATLARLHEALLAPLVFDELYAIRLSRSGLATLLTTLSLDVEQPLHFVLTWAWHSIGGEHALWIKTPPILFGLATVWVVALAGRQMFGAAAGLLAAALLAFHPTHVFYSQQGTFHSLVWLLLTLAVWLAWRWVRDGGRADALGLVIAGAAALYTDYFSAFVLGAILLWGLFALGRAPRRRLVWLGLMAAIVLIFSPQIPTLLAQIRRDVLGELHLDPLSSADIREMVRKLSFGMSYLIVPLAALAASLLARASTRAAASLLWTVGLIGVLAPWALSVAGNHLFIIRQMFYNMPLACLAFAAGALSIDGSARTARLARLTGRWAAVLLLALVVRAWWLQRPFEEAVRLREATEFLATRAAPGDLVVCPEPRALLFVRHHLERLDARLLIMPESDEFHHSDGILIVPDEWMMKPADLDRAIERGTPWWGVRSQHAGRDGPEAAARLDALARGGVTNFGRVTVWSGVRHQEGQSP